MISLSTVAEMVATNATLTYGAILLLAVIETLPVVGTVVPGTGLIVAIAALVPTGAMQMWPLLIVTFIGGVIGDAIPYWLGHRYREATLARWPFNRYPDVTRRSRQFVERHGGKSIFLARFTPGLRGFVPLLAGTVGMPPGRFYAVNVFSGLIWSAALILPGVLLGASLAAVGEATWRLVVLLIVVISLLWAVFWTLRLALRRGPPLAAAVEARVREWLSSRDTWLAREVRSLLYPGRGETRALLLWALVVIAAAWLFLGVLEDVVTGDPLIRADAAIYQALQGLRTPTGDAIMIAVTELGDNAVTLPLTLVVFLWLAVQRAWRTAAYWAAAVAFAATLNTITKLAIHRARPVELVYEGATQFSFPSGHATVNAVIYGFLAFLVTRRLRPAWRLPVFVAALFFAALIAFSRLYLGAHWFSDIVGSLAFAVAWLIVLGIAYARHRERPFSRRGLAIVALTAVALIGGFNVTRNHAGDTLRYTAVDRTPTIAASTWLAEGWRQAPAYRIDLSGEYEEPLILQWAGTLPSLKAKLGDNGWRVPVPWTFPTALAWLTSADAETLPVFPALNAGRLPALTLIRPVPGVSDARLVLRAWTAEFSVTSGDRWPVWLVSVVEERMSRPLSLFMIPWTAQDAIPPEAILPQSVADSHLVRRDIRGSRWAVLLASEALGVPAPPPDPQGTR